MNVKLLEPYGFCPGVEKAIKIAEVSLTKGKNENKKVYFEHQLVHNEQVDKLLKDYGSYEIYSNQILTKDDIFLISAHGHNYDLDKKIKEATIVSAFCSLLQNRFQKIKKSIDENKKLYYLGEINHPESISTISYIKNKLNYEVSILKNKEEFLEIEKQGFPNKTLLIVQSTFKENILSNDINLEIIGSCPFVYRREEYLKKSKDYHTYIVVGSTSSSNTKSLYNLINKLYPNKLSYLINSIEDLKDKKLAEPILITSGTSALKKTIEEIYEYILKI